MRLSPTGAVRAVSLVDGRLLQRATDDPFRLELDRPVADLALTLDDSGLLDIASSRRLPTLGVDAPGSVINRVRIDDLAASFHRSATGVVVPAEQETSATRRPAASPSTGARNSLTADA